MVDWLGVELVFLAPAARVGGQGAFVLHLAKLLFQLTDVLVGDDGLITAQHRYLLDAVVAKCNIPFLHYIPQHRNC